MLKSSANQYKLVPNYLVPTKNNLSKELSIRNITGHIENSQSSHIIIKEPCRGLGSSLVYLENNSLAKLERHYSFYSKIRKYFVTIVEKINRKNSIKLSLSKLKK